MILSLPKRIFIIKIICILTSLGFISFHFLPNIQTGNQYLNSFVILFFNLFFYYGDSLYPNFPAGIIGLMLIFLSLLLYLKSINRTAGYLGINGTVIYLIYLINMEILRQYNILFISKYLITHFIAMSTLIILLISNIAMIFIIRHQDDVRNVNWKIIKENIGSFFLILGSSIYISHIIFLFFAIGPTHPMWFYDPDWFFSKTIQLIFVCLFGSICIGGAYLVIKIKNKKQVYFGVFLSLIGIIGAIAGLFITILRGTFFSFNMWTTLSSSFLYIDLSLMIIGFVILLLKTSGRKSIRLKLEQISKQV